MLGTPIWPNMRVPGPDLCSRRLCVCSVCLVRLRDNGCREVDHEDDDDEDDSGRGFPLLRVEGR